MKKKFAAMLTACLCVAEATSAVAPIAAPVTVEAATKTTTKKKKAPTLNKVYKAVKKAYGDDYTPDQSLTENAINERYGLKSSWYKGVVADNKMININPAELVIVKAKNDKSKKKIKKALANYKKQQVQNNRFYNASMLKCQAAKIYVKGNYVCFIMLGEIDNKTEEQGDEKVIAAYKKQNEKAVDAIKKLY